MTKEEGAGIEEEVEDTQQEVEAIITIKQIGFNRCQKSQSL